MSMAERIWRLLLLLCGGLVVVSIVAIAQGHVAEGLLCCWTAVASGVSIGIQRP